MHPKLKDLNQVYYYIQKNSDYENNMILLFSVEAYLKLFIVIVLIMLIIKFIKKKNEKGRLLIVLPVICVFLIIIYAFQIQNYNQETLDKCKDISWFIAGSVNMSKPKHTIALTKVNDLWIIGYYHHGVPSWKKYDDKPNTFSNSLDIRLARTLINIAGENDQTKTMIDPCCGMGTVVLEGLALGYSIKGFDISRDISWKARCNLNHFGFDGMLITKDDINKHQGHYDIAIIDIPYNLYTPITYKEQCDIINSARKLCNKLVLVSYEQMDQEIKQAGFEIRNRILRKKTEFVKFGRYIYVCY